MENIIKGLHYLIDMPEEKVDEMERIALVLWQNFYLKFKVLEYDQSKVIIKVTQEKAAPDYPGINAFSNHELINIVHKEFDKFFLGGTVLAHPFPFISNPVSDVNYKWIEGQMLTTGTRLKDIAADTGLNKSYLSNLINGKDPLSDMAKAMFYYYFLSKGDKIGNGHMRQKKDD
jgi:hypothetical protein